MPTLYVRANPKGQTQNIKAHDESVFSIIVMSKSLYSAFDPLPYFLLQQFL